MSLIFDGNRAVTATAAALCLTFYGHCAAAFEKNHQGFIVPETQSHYTPQWHETSQLRASRLSNPSEAYLSEAARAMNPFPFKRKNLKSRKFFPTYKPATVEVAYEPTSPPLYLKVNFAVFREQHFLSLLVAAWGSVPADCLLHLEQGHCLLQLAQSRKTLLLVHCASSQTDLEVRLVAF